MVHHFRNGRGRVGSVSISARNCQELQGLLSLFIRLDLRMNESSLQGKPICARIKKKPMDRVLNSGPPATPTGTVGSTTPTAPGAPSPVAVTPTQNPQSKNGYGEYFLTVWRERVLNVFIFPVLVPGAPPQIATGAQPVTAAVPGGATSVANIMSTIPATSQAYQFVPGQQPSSLPTMQQAPNSSQIYYVSVVYFSFKDNILSHQDLFFSGKWQTTTLIFF